MASIAFFDVDGTLMKGFSGYYTTLELMRKRIIKKRRLPLAIFYKAVASLYTGNVRKMYEIAIADMAGSSAQRIFQIGRETFDKYLKARVYREALEEIKKHQALGNRVILISSGPTMAVKIMEEFVGAEVSYSIGPVIEKEILQNRLQEPFVYREGKIEAARLEAQRKNISLTDCFFYADTHHDLPLLSAVGHPSVVNPDRRLRKVALEKGWPILEFKDLLGRGGRKD
jgi:HAD superfamily hydrolase (TIGR01490 family)